MIKLNSVKMDEPVKSGASQKKLGSTYRELIDLNKIDGRLRKKCISLSFELHNMNSADRLAFMFEEPSFPQEEKLIMLDTCIKVLEEREYYEMCATLFRMRSGLNSYRIN
jgi:hypothetical protein